MTNPFSGRVPALAGPAMDIVPVVPNDGADLTQGAVALYVETGGALQVTSVLGSVRNVNVADNSILPVGVLRVHATGTTATGIHALVVS
ncbi:hypothetical protein [Aestuariibius sp. HNIBRBA575]|uniref:spike base protein, RCAP_Rcc01079 family n=1 Tax=Aestuariibius sp. HNIBRBA575 TaxID=3233343 RepID=UPI0034A13073